jgi:hypothetical protein
MQNPTSFTLGKKWSDVGEIDNRRTNGRIFAASRFLLCFALEQSTYEGENEEAVNDSLLPNIFLASACSRA